MTVSNSEARTNALLQAPALGEQLGMSVSSIYRRRSLGLPLPPAIKIGSQVRWRQSDVDEWIEAQKEDSNV